MGPVALRHVEDGGPCWCRATICLEGDTGKDCKEKPEGRLPTVNDHSGRGVQADSIGGVLAGTAGPRRIPVPDLEEVGRTCGSADQGK